MGLVIWLPVSVVNSVIFFFIDVPAAWAIHRGLLALQRFYLYRITKRSHTFPIARSRIPIFAGELVQGRTAYPSFFVLVNIAIYFLLLFATLGVDPDMRQVWEPKSFRNRTTFAMPISAATDTDSYRAQYYYSDVEQHELLCKTSNETHLQIWPLMFDEEITPGRGFPPYVHPTNMSCQIEAPETEPLLTLQCTSLDDEKCNIEEKGVQSRTRLGKSLQTGSKNLTHVLSRNVSVEEYGFQGLTTYRTFLDSSASNTDSKSFGRAFVWRNANLREDPFHKARALIFYHTSYTNSSFVAIAAENGLRREFYLHAVFRITYSASSTREFLFLSCRKNLDLANFMAGVYLTNGIENHRRPSSVILQTILRESVRAVPLPASGVGYIRKPDKDATVISTRATVLYIIIIALAIVLCPVRELLIFVLVHRRKVPKTAIFLNNFNELSKMYRATVERMSGVAPTGRFAVWEIVRKGS